MSLGIRIVLLLGALAMTVFVLRSIKKSKMRIEDALFWIFLSLFILLLSIFPAIAVIPAGWFGFQAPVNFVFLLFIAILLVKCFTMSRHTSQLETKIKELTQQIAVDRLDHYERSKRQ
ncbi:MAG: DUF2304 domain-containing protein [Coriobacteriaceae bacterium]|nr:DUF2304 domain-containing protein [Coriobacteriaceae bacterium]MDO4890087.1 DUF2304 domain-containing protein [Coriobacteriaceae bacterium]